MSGVVGVRPLLTLMLATLTGMSRAETVCQSMASDAATVSNSGSSAYKPSCTDDGAFVPRQCLADAGPCWCVNANGTRIPGTDTPVSQDPPDCSTVSVANLVACYKCEWKGQNWTTEGPPDGNLCMFDTPNTTMLDANPYLYTEMCDLSKKNHCATRIMHYHVTKLNRLIRGCVDNQCGKFDTDPEGNPVTASGTFCCDTDFCNGDNPLINRSSSAGVTSASAIVIVFLVLFAGLV